ncbi:MAG: pyruvate formate-lyase 1-activating enzyme [Clostridiales bacterium GWF2_38_85]|nr:MAG: pyruvate formate-lyase 1-activating enzyme [Clostridiales bacterium GWF2_38_85]HBL83772.1 pyruvate formate lyase-activating protein [Clostridiales bacterium]
MNPKTTGQIHSFETFGAVDGPGVRFVVFFQGCPLRCLYCHNPDSWNTNIGRVITAEELVKEILKYRSFISKGGVTLSGGEPFLQSEFAEAVITLCKQNKLHTAIDTSGYIPLSVCKGAVDAADMLLLDIKAIDTHMAKKLTGAGIENAIKLLNYCESINKRVWIRHVLLPGWTLDKEQAHSMGVFLKDYKCVEKVELLPFHKFGEYKWESLNLEYSLGNVEPPEPEQVEEIRQILIGYGLNA